MWLKNRFVAAPMVSNHCDELGYITQRVLDTYEVQARGGVALYQTMAFFVHPTSVLFRAPGIEHDGRIAGAAELAYAIHRGGAKAAMQLVHGGPLAPPPAPGMQSLGPSPSESTFAPGTWSKEMTEEEIEMIIEAFGQAAGRAKRAGFDAVNIHSCHGSLIQLFMSKGANRRKDKWGKDLLLFPLKVLERVRQLVGPDYPIIWRISGDEFYGEAGYSLDDVLKYAPILEEAGVDCFDVSAGRIGLISGSYIMQPVYRPRGTIVYLAEAIKKVVKVPVIAVGKIMDPKMAAKIVEEGKADLVALGRPIWADPEYPKKALEGRSEDIRKCLSCNFCMRGIFTGTATRCAVNAEFGREYKYRIQRADEPKKVLIIGGGVAGMEAARVAALRKHHVILYEKEKRLGGLVNLAANIPRLYTRDLYNIVEYLTNQLAKLDITIEMEQEVTLDVINQLKPDIVVLATGSRLIWPDIPGIKSPWVIGLDDYINRAKEVGQRVVIIGGHEGAEIAVSLAREKKEVTVIEGSENIAQPFYMFDILRQSMLMEYIQQEEIRVLTKTQVKEIQPGQVIIIPEAGQEQVLPVDSVIIAWGRQPNKELADALQKANISFYDIGDCVEPRSIVEAIDDAAYVARLL
jgi:2,4-dienoyl-CoA reductase-like NADH-dependent reductase (Old Yellow Enzyme family)/thioredoxin reductase